MLSPNVLAFFDQAYATELVFKPGCWSLCGDAHCCSFQRHKARFTLLRSQAQELPLLPGEWAYLCARGWHRQFEPYELRTHEYPLEGYTLRWLSLASRRPGCACDHATRTVICRLYPLLPTFSPAGQLTGTESVGMYEELETLEGLAPACKVDAVPFGQLNLFLQLSQALGEDPLRRLYLLAYQHAKRHVFSRLAATRQPGLSAFRQFELGVLRDRLFDHPTLRTELQQLLIAVSAGDPATFAARAAEVHAADLSFAPPISAPGT